MIVGDEAATEALRASTRAERGELPVFDMGPALDKVLERCQGETGHAPPKAPEPLPWAPMESAEDALRRVREQEA